MTVYLVSWMCGLCGEWHDVVLLAESPDDCMNKFEQFWEQTGWLLADQPKPSLVAVSSMFGKGGWAHGKAD